MTEVLLKTILLGGGLLYCGYILGRDSGIRQGANDAIDRLCLSGYLKFRRTGRNLREVELIKLNGEKNDS